MQQDVEQFLAVLEAERGFSVNTIFAYRNDLTQFIGFLLDGPVPRPEGWADLTEAEYLLREHRERHGSYRVGGVCQCAVCKRTDAFLTRMEKGE